MNKNRTSRLATALPWWALAAGVALADFAIKHLVRVQLPEGSVIPLTSFFNVVSVRNPGAAFSMLADAGGWQRYFLAALAIGVSVVLGWILFQSQRRLEAVAYSLILGGALGNAYDRIAFGEVTDYLDFHAAGWHWPAFNGADIAIFLGAVSLVLAACAGRRTEALASRRSGA